MHMRGNIGIDKANSVSVTSAAGRQIGVSGARYWLATSQFSVETSQKIL